MFKDSSAFNQNNKSRKSSEDINIPPDTLEDKMIVKVNAELLHIDMFPYIRFNEK